MTIISVCPSAGLSYSLVQGVETTKHIVELFTAQMKISVNANVNFFQYIAISRE